MTNYGPQEFWLAYLVSNPAAKKPAPTTNGESALDDLLGDKVQSLATILVEIQDEVAQRASLSASVRRLIYQHYSYVKTKLLALDMWPLSSDRAIEQRRSQLEDKLDQLLHEVRREHIESWQDQARLRTELWRWFKQYSDVAQRVRLVLSETHGGDGGRSIGTR